MTVTWKDSRNGTCAESFASSRRNMRAESEEKSACAKWKKQLAMEELNETLGEEAELMETAASEEAEDSFAEPEEPRTKARADTAGEEHPPFLWKARS